jgi:hypothetical protein
MIDYAIWNRLETSDDVTVGNGSRLPRSGVRMLKGVLEEFAGSDSSVKQRSDRANVEFHRGAWNLVISKPETKLPTSND